jgi:hypothetical protein
MKGKRAIAACGLVGAVTMGAMVLAGTAAEATTTSTQEYSTAISPQSDPQACAEAQGAAAQLILASGNNLPNPTTPETLYDDLEFLAAAVGVNTPTGQSYANVANDIADDCS